MLHKYNQEQSNEFNVDLKSNIVLYTTNDSNFIKSDDGKLLLCNINDINLSDCKTTLDGLSKCNLDYRMQLKLSIPYGIIPMYTQPDDSKIYIRHIYKDNKVDEILENEDTNIPEYIEYKDIIFELYLDISKIRQFDNSMYIKKNTPILQLEFIYTINYYRHILNKIDNIYIVNNTDLFSTI